MRFLPSLAALLLCAACAGRPAVRPEGAPTRVVVVTASRVPKPQVRGISGQLVGEDEPREVLAREAQRALEARGFVVLGSATSLELAPSEAQVKSLMEQHGAEAAVVLVLTRLDLSALRPLGQAEVGLETRLVARDGRTLWSGARQEATRERLYRAQTDWRSHLRLAVDASVREVP